MTPSERHERIQSIIDFLNYKKISRKDPLNLNAQQYYIRKSGLTVLDMYGEYPDFRISKTVRMLESNYQLQIGGLSRFKFDTDWNWLMFLLNRIESHHDNEGFRERVTISTTFARIGEMEIRIIDGDSRKERIFVLASDWCKKINDGKKES